MVGLFDADVELGIAGHAEGFTRRGFHPLVAAGQLVFAGAAHAFHGFGRARAEGEAGRQDHADRFLGAISQREAMAHAFAVEVHIGLGGEAYVVDFFGGHEDFVRV